MQAAAEKASLRASMKRALLAAPPAQREDWSARIVPRLAALEPFTSARTILLFAPMIEAGEVDIAPLAAVAAGAGKRLAVPRPDWDAPAHARSMAAAQVADLGADLVPDPANPRLRRPRPAAPEIPPDQIDLVLVPGLAFDPEGRRLGRGGGFYDRFLAEPRLRAALVGVCFDLQVVPRVPAEPHDRRVDMVVTESRLIAADPDRA